MSLLKWFYTEIGSGSPPPHLVYYALRGGMFLLSFVLEDWAIYELVPSPRHRRAIVVLVASSYVTWTYQTHTFSNSLETLLVAWGLVLIRRIVENKVRRDKASTYTIHADLTPSDTRPSSPTPCSPSSPWWASSTASHSRLSFYSRVCNCCLSSSASASIYIHFASNSLIHMY
jgi:phosphatidylinositol glycan class Z